MECSSRDLLLALSNEQPQSLRCSKQYRRRRFKCVKMFGRSAEGKTKRAELERAIENACTTFGNSVAISLSRFLIICLIGDVGEVCINEVFPDEVVCVVEDTGDQVRFRTTTKSRAPREWEVRKVKELPRMKGSMHPLKVQRIS